MLHFLTVQYLEGFFNLHGDLRGQRQACEGPAELGSPSFPTAVHTALLPAHCPKHQPQVSITKRKLSHTGHYKHKKYYTRVTQELDSPWCPEERCVHPFCSGMTAVYQHVLAPPHYSPWRNGQSLEGPHHHGRNRSSVDRMSKPVMKSLWYFETKSMKPQ